MEHPLRRWIPISIATICLLVAIISAPVPGFPSSLFLVISVAILAKTSPQLEQRVRDHRLLGAWIGKVEELPRRRKILLLIGWITSLAVGAWLVSRVAAP